MSNSSLSQYPRIILVWHWNIWIAVANELQRLQGTRVFAILGTSGGILIPNQAVFDWFFGQDISRETQRSQLDKKVRLDTLLADANPNDFLIIDASSNLDPAAHTDLFNRWFTIVSANKNPLGLWDAETAMKMLNSPRYGGETTVMAWQGVLGFIGDERINLNSTWPIESITQIDLIWSGTLSGIAVDLANGIPYSEAVKAAIKRGDTEPNPNDDMDGMDLAKKLVILARKAGYNVNINNVKFWDGFLDRTFRDTFEWQDWWNKDHETDAQRWFIEKIMNEKDTYMKDLIEKNKPNVSRYIGRMLRKSDGTIELSVGIEFVPLDSEHCAAKFNKTIITINRWWDAPLDIKTISGRWAGPTQTAQWIMRDVNRVLKYSSNS
jgi:bifunctional aspartokinase / homoserine dehydrogenase 1